MLCDQMHERITLAIYSELADEATHELELHIAACPVCREEREQMQALKTLAGLYTVSEPDANLIARARIRLADSLDNMPALSWQERLRSGIPNMLAASLHASPVAAGLLLVAGLGSGVLGGYEYATEHALRIPPPIVASPVHASVNEDSVNGDIVPANIASISSITRSPNSETVEVRYNQVVPQTLHGTLDDPKVRQLLMLASAQDETGSNSGTGIHDNSVDLLAGECQAGHGCARNGIRDALIVALRYDRSAHVREKAMNGLKPYIADDIRVRDAVLESLLNDPDPKIRSSAINMLEPVEADTSVREVLYTVAARDGDAHIRTVSRQALSRAPEIQ